MDITKTINELRTLVSSIKFGKDKTTEQDNKFLDITDENGNILRVETEELVIGEVIKMVTDDVEVAIPESEIKLEDGRTIKTDIDSNITEIIEAESEEEEEETEEVETSKEFAIIKQVDKWEIEVDADSIEVGTQLKQTGEDGDAWTLNDGEYELEDGSKIQVDAEGIVVLITPKDGAETEEKEVETEEEMLEVETETETEEVETETEEVETETETEINNRIESLENLVKELIENQNVMNNAQMSMVDIVEEFSKKPVADKVNLKSLFNKTEKANTRDKNLEAIRNFRSKK